MIGVVSDKLAKSSRTFKDIVEPVLLEMMGGEFILVEANPDPLYMMMDLLSGIDVLHVSSSGIRGMASRIQYGKAWDTFTVRMSRQSGMDTEFNKRVLSIDNGYMYPYWTMQAYVLNGELLSLAVAKTEDVLQMIKDGHCKERYVLEDGRNAVFSVVDWDMMESMGYEFIRV